MSGSLLSGCSRILIGACLLFVAGSLLAQDRPLFPGQNQPQAAGNNDALSLLLDQNNQMRAELQALRALVEEQGFEIRRLQRESLNRYTNMDERLQALENGAAPPAAVTDNTLPGQSSPAVTTLPPAAEPSPVELPGAETSAANELAPVIAAPLRSRPSALPPAVLSEQQLYQMAYESAINSSFERSIAEFDQYLSVYPQGRFVSNAHYWKGQSFLYLERFNEAREVYEIILNEFGDSPKLPDAMYGLGQAYQGLGETARARDLFNSIKRRYPNTGVANLADTRLQSLD